MRTIGRRWPSQAPRGDHPRLCDYCGVKWRASVLRRTVAGLYACPDDYGDRHHAGAPHVIGNDPPPPRPPELPPSVSRPEMPLLI